MAIQCICLIGVMIIMLTGQSEPQDKYGNASFRHGYWFHIEDGEDDITVNASSWSGMERVFINDELVSKHRRLTFKSKHQIEHNGAAYEVALTPQNLLTGKYVCEVIKNGASIGTKTIAFLSGTPGQVLAKLVPFFGFGMLVGAGSVVLGKVLVSTSFAYGMTLGIPVGIALAVAIVFFINKRKKS